MKLTSILLLLLGTSVSASGAPGAEQPQAAGFAKVAAFDGIANRSQRSLALYQEALKVIEHPRCLNCHPKADRPTQTESMRAHIPAVSRGATGHGFAGMKCATCHQSKNVEAAGVPGAAHWGLAPVQMAWQGKSSAQICAQIKNPALNGNRSLDQLLIHVREDPLVGWAWQPGAGRLPAPGSQEEFGELIRAWIATGAVCPQHVAPLPGSRP